MILCSVDWYSTADAVKSFKDVVMYSIYNFL